MKEQQAKRMEDNSIMSVTIDFRRVISMGYYVEKTESWHLYVVDGEVVKISYSSYTITPMGSQDGDDRICSKGDNGFVQEFKKAIKILYSCNKIEYNRLLEALNNEVINTYFEKVYIPK